MIDESVFEGRGPTGEYRDLLRDPHGRIVWEGAWQHNLIVDGMRQMLAALVKGDPQGKPIAFWAVGNGTDAWDSGAIPADPVVRARNALFNESGRKAVPPGQIKFLPPGSTFTNQLEIDLDFTTADIAVPAGPVPAGGWPAWHLREFGLVAGGTTAANSGVLLNLRIHPRIDMQAGFTLQRTLRLTF